MSVPEEQEEYSFRLDFQNNSPTPKASNKEHKCEESEEAEFIPWGKYTLNNWHIQILGEHKETSPQIFIRWI